ncbi:MAG: GNAT family N-acetyltransferase [Acidimicrobiia bacterium]|nr:GNAT family N-acetyltransferase [Acidimicrobiia bacterium]
MGRATPVLTTKRLTLSAPRANDADVIFPFVHGEPGRVVTDMLLWDGPASIEELRDYYEKYVLKEEPDSVEFGWAIRDRAGAITGTPGRPLGSIGARLSIPPGAAEIGYYLAPPYQRRGLMSEAIRTVVSYAFDEWGSSSVRAEVFTGNEASQRLLESLGFRNVGTLPEQHEKRGETVDSYGYEVAPGQLRLGSE